MTGFLVKKFFYDAWDNFFFIAALNFGFYLFLALSFFLLPILQTAGIVLFFILVYLLFVYLCAASSVLKEVSDYRRSVPADFFINIKSAFVPASVLFAAAVFVFMLIRLTIPVYLAMENLPGLGAAFFSCWVCLFIVASIQFYPAVYYRLGKHPIKSLKKCAIIFFDNTGFSFFILFFGSLLSVLILPFPGCTLLFLDEALRLRLLKYDWLDAQAAGQNSENHKLRSGKTKIPWNEILAEEKENTGTRTLKSFIFPWK
ncbi:MAG: hypothetical protein FWG29_05770 [Treponema sp.]|nr:hypothetical protein [Treponema sp.]